MRRLLLLLFISALTAQAAFYRTQLSDLSYQENADELLAADFEEWNWKFGWGQKPTRPIARFGKFSFVVSGLTREFSRRNSGSKADAWLVIEMDQPEEIGGFVDLWSNEKGRWVSYGVKTKSEKLVKCSEEETAIVRERFARHRLTTGSPGGIYYRNQIEGEPSNRREREFDRTFTVLSGGRALAENMALDRELILGETKDEKKVALSSIKGVTVKPIPWAEKMPKEEIAVDVLSKRVPEDQYFMVVSSVQQLFGLMDRLEATGTPILQSFSVGRSYRDLPSRYRRQLGLDLPDAMARFLPVKSVAVTGGDPFFPTGSDVAVILETDKSDFVFSALQTAVAAKAKAARATEIDGGFVNESRSFSCFLAKLDGAVVVSNSARQLAKLKAVEEGKAHALGSTDEYRFFRHRYPMGKDESAYVFISDACLRHWAGPEVRIGASRRSRALAALGQLTSKQVSGEELSQEFAPLLGEVKKSGEMIYSEHYGSLGFLTPIGELEIEQVSTMEKEAYERWRRGYEGGWAKFFDPIAIRLELSKEKEELDMTILPLRVDSDYQEMISLAGEAQLSKAAMSISPGAAFHFAMAIDRKSRLFKEADVSLVEILPSLKVNPLGWMGESVSVTLGQSLAWQGSFSEEMLQELPLLLRVEVESRVKLALFLAAVKGSIESSAPELVRWETREHEGRKYVAIIGDPEEIGADVSLYYAGLPSALLVSLNEEMLKTALAAEKTLPKGSGEEQLYAQTSPEFLKKTSEMGGGMSLEERRQGLSWAALPLLNEWYLAKSAKDPAAYHEARFAHRIHCPGDLGYRWNEKDLTMESVAYGHPAKPRQDAKALNILSRFKGMEMSASFEEGGMRLKLALKEKSDIGELPLKSTPRPADDQVVLFRDLIPTEKGVSQIHEFEESYGDDEEPEKGLWKTEVLSVVEKDDVILVETKYENLSDDEDVPGVSVMEIGPKGVRTISDVGDGELVPDPEGIDFPAELWPGLVFRSRKKETWLGEDGPTRALTDDVITIIGWEKIEGPGGAELQALKMERKFSNLSDEYFDRGTSYEWYALGYGIVKLTTSSAMYQSSMNLVELREKR